MRLQKRLRKKRIRYVTRYQIRNIKAYRFGMSFYHTDGVGYLEGFVKTACANGEGVFCIQHVEK